MGKGNIAKQSKSRSKPIESGAEEKRITFPETAPQLDAAAGGVAAGGCRIA